MGQERDELGRGIRWLSEHTPNAEAQQAHLRALRGAVSGRPSTAPGLVTGSAPKWRRRVALGTAWGMIAVPGAAVAAENSAPGDLLYPIKRAVEPVRSVFDPSVRARHRVDEVARLIDRKVEADRLARALTDAHDSLGEDDDDLRVRLDELSGATSSNDNGAPTSRPTRSEPTSRPSPTASDDDRDDDEDRSGPSTRPSDDEDSADDEPRVRPSDDEDTPEVSDDDAPDEAVSEKPTSRPSPKPSATNAPTDDDGPDDEPDDEDTPDEPEEDTPDAPDVERTSRSGSNAGSSRDEADD